MALDAVPLDRTGTKVSEIAFGTWRFGREDDTGHIEADREDYAIASKIYWPTRADDPNGRGLDRKHLRYSIDAILERLRTDYVDLRYIHRWDDDIPAEEFMATLNEFVRDGKVHYLGTSTFEPNAWTVAKANEIAAREDYEPFTVAQPRYNAVNREVEGNYLEMCATTTSVSSLGTHSLGIPHRKVQSRRGPTRGLPWRNRRDVPRFT